MTSLAGRVAGESALDSMNFVIEPHVRKVIGAQPDGRYLKAFMHIGAPGIQYHVTTHTASTDELILDLGARALASANHGGSIADVHIPISRRIAIDIRRPPRCFACCCGRRIAEFSCEVILYHQNGISRLAMWKLPIRRAEIESQLVTHRTRVIHCNG